MLSPFWRRKLLLNWFFHFQIWAI